VVDAEEHRAISRDALRVPDVDRLEAEPEPEANDEPHGRIEAVRGIGGSGRLSRSGAIWSTWWTPSSRWSAACENHSDVIHDRLPSPWTRIARKPGQRT